MWRASKLVISSGWQEALRAERLDTVAAIYESKAGEVVTQSGSTEVRRVELRSGPGPRVIFIKKYWVNRARQLWSGMFRGTFLGRSKARREFENLGLLRGWGLDAPEPVAYGEDRQARWLMRSCLVSAGVPDPVPLDRFIRDELPAKQEQDNGRRRTLILALAAATRRLHEHRFVHHDYFWRNIILSGGRLDRFWLIDAHKGRQHGASQENRWPAIDLAALDAAAVPYFRRVDRLRFLLAYCGRRRLDGASRDLLQAVLRRAEPMRAKQIQRVELAQTFRAG